MARYGRYERLVQRTTSIGGTQWEVSDEGRALRARTGSFRVILHERSGEDTPEEVRASWAPIDRGGPQRTTEYRGGPTF